MLKVALLTAAVLVAASTALATNPTPESGASAAPEAPCHAALSPDRACALHSADAGNDAAIASAELSGLASPPPVIDWTPLHAAPGSGLDFKDAATEPGSVLPAAPDRDSSHPLIPALLALGAMVILLRKRPV